MASTYDDYYLEQEQYYTTAGIIIAVAAGLLGLFLTFVGYRLYYIYLFASGFVGAGGLTLILIVSFTISDDISKIVLTLVIGSIAGFFTLLFHYLGVAVAGVILGLFISGIVAMEVTSTLAIVIIALSVSVICAVFCCIFDRWGIYITSSVMGAYGVVAGIDFLSKSHGGLIYIYPRLFGLQDVDDWPNWLTWFLLGVAGVLALLGFFVQARFSGRKYQHLPIIVFSYDPSREDVYLEDEMSSDEEEYFQRQKQMMKSKIKKLTKKDKKKKKRNDDLFD